MLKVLVSLILLCSVVHAQEVENVRIREIKSWVMQLGEAHTCADEYLERRKQVSKKLAWSPLLIAGSFVSGGVAGLALGHAAFVVSGVPSESFNDLAYTIGGGLLGVVAGAGTAVATTTVSGVQFFNNQRLLKAIYESRNGAAKSLGILHRKFLKLYPQHQIDIQEFAREVSELDISGKLCDGSIAKPKRFKKGKKLKQRLATRKEILAKINLNLSEPIVLN